MIKPNLEANIGGLRMKNPVMVASGTFGYGEEYGDLVDLNRLGAVVVKGITLEPKEGCPPPRIVETSCGMLNAVGLENVGVKAFIKERLPHLRGFDVPIIVNINGKDAKEYGVLAKILDGVEGISGLEVNISCPNVKAGGIYFGQDQAATYEVVTRVREVTNLPLIVKLTPNVTDITLIAKEAARAGADGLSLINTILGMAIDIHTRRPKLANITGGLSGPAIKPIALRMVWQVAQVVDLPIVGQGGIMTAEDAIEFILAGAKAIAVGTATFVNPKASIEIIEGIEEYLLREGIEDINALRM
ncbi:TPA: dihydroorotate dehydrogenase [bacterium]|nr:dihydroorotate dehydrogenase [bacterium]